MSIAKNFCRFTQYVFLESIGLVNSPKFGFNRGSNSVLVARASGCWSCSSFLWNNLRNLFSGLSRLSGQGCRSVSLNEIKSNRVWSGNVIG